MCTRCMIAGSDAAIPLDQGRRLSAFAHLQHACWCDGPVRAICLTTFPFPDREARSEEHTSELQSRGHLVCRLLLEKKKTKHNLKTAYHTHVQYTSPAAGP